MGKRQNQVYKPCHFHVYIRNKSIFNHIGKDYESKYKLALQLLSSQHLSAHNHETEFSIVQNIKKLLAVKDRLQDARKFDELYARLKASVNSLL